MFVTNYSGLLFTLTQRPGHSADSCKLGYCEIAFFIISFTGFLPATRVEFSSPLETLTSSQRAGSSRATQLANFSTSLRI